MANWWEGYPWRMIQTNLREIDMLDIDAPRFVADLVAFKATVVLINAAGISASYPTRLPFHYQGPYLKGDSLADIIDCLLYTSPSPRDLSTSRMPSSA